MPVTLDGITNLTDNARNEGQGKAWFTSMRASMVERGDPLVEPDVKQNISFTVQENTPGANQLTISLKRRDGSNATAEYPLAIAFRNAVLATGDYNIRNVTGAVSTVISAGSTGGHINAFACPLYVYAIEVGTAFEVAWSTKYHGTQVIVSTTAEGGAGAADSASVMYSTTARASVAAVCIGRWLSTQTTAGNWATSSGQKDLAPTENASERIAFHAYSSSTQTDVTGSGGTIGVVFGTESFDLGGNFASSTFTAPYTGLYQFDIQVKFGGLLSTHTEGRVNFNGPTDNPQFGYVNIGAVRDLNNEATIQGSGLFRVVAGSACSCSAFVGNGTQVVDLLGDGSSPRRTYFSGYLVYRD